MRCDVEGCESEAHARSMCGMHYRREVARLRCLGEWKGVRHEGVCVGCSKRFFAKVRDKKFCSQDCYVKSDYFKALCKERSERMRRPVDIQCLACGKVFVTSPRNAKDGGHPGAGGKKYCNRNCFREFMAKRFDRFVANPETISLPQCYDEFLTKEELPCLAVGCRWRGLNLSLHMNFTHGVEVETFKEMAGFNKGTGVVAPSAFKRYRKNTTALMSGLERAGRPLPDREAIRRTRGSARPEAREHHGKTLAINGKNPGKWFSDPPPETGRGG